MIVRVSLALALSLIGLAYTSSFGNVKDDALDELAG